MLTQRRAEFDGCRHKPKGLRTGLVGEDGGGRGDLCMHVTDGWKLSATAFLKPSLQRTGTEIQLCSRREIPQVGVGGD